MTTQISEPLFDGLDFDKAEPRRIRVLLPLPLAGAFDYLAQDGLAAKPGDFVQVPLGSRSVVGVVWDHASADAVADGATKPVDLAKLKPIEAVLVAPPLPKENRLLVDWISKYYLCPPGAALRMAMSAPSALEPPRAKTAYIGIGAPEAEQLKIKWTPSRRRVLEAAQDGFARSASELASEAGVSASVVTKLAALGGLEPVQILDKGRFKVPDPSAYTPLLSDQQAAAADVLREMVAATRFDVALLDGVTGSGKTEVYFEAIAKTLKQGRQVLVLLPEIALSSQWLARFEARFGAAPAEWHSDLNQRRRRQSWRAVAEGEARLVVGARSALHLPFPDLGLIIVDEEHESAFKQEDGVPYHARDMAVVRARIGACPVVLVSATPSLESAVNARDGKYRLLKLPERHGGAALPKVEIIDTIKNKPGRGLWITPTLRRALEETLEAGDQALLFLNRRGYAPLTLCRTCGHRLQCPNCTAWLVEHRFTQRLQCHHCGYSARLPKSCPECEDEDSFAACGPGVERLYEEALRFLPEARCEVVTSDTIRNATDAADFVARMTDGEINLVIGTQIVAKGYHFPHLTLVGIIDADLGLNGGDPRAAERSYQLLHQVGGRAGRAEKPGRVLLQTSEPGAAIFKAIAEDDRDGFLEAEIAGRRMSRIPPFGRMAGVIVSSPDESVADAVAQALAREAPRAPGLEILGPAPAPLALLRGRYRRRLLVSTEMRVSVQKVLSEWLSRVKPPNNTRIRVDIDPYSFL